MQAASTQQVRCPCSPQALIFSRSVIRQSVSCRAAVTPGSSSLRGCTRTSSPLSSCRTPFLGVSPLSSPAGCGSFPARGRARHVPRAQQGPDIPDRLAGAIPYLVPLFDSLKYGERIQETATVDAGSLGVQLPEATAHLEPAPVARVILHHSLPIVKVSGKSPDRELCDLHLRSPSDKENRGVWYTGPENHHSCL